jgi:HEAT repeat protein
MTNLPNASSRAIALRDLSPYGQHTAGWLRTLARGVQMSRLYSSSNPAVVAARDTIVTKLMELVNQHGSMDLRITMSEILLMDEPVVRPGPDKDANSTASEQQLPFQFYRDGIRRIVILRDLPRLQGEVLVDALRATGSIANTQDDLVTLLWQGNLSHIHIETVPIEQTIYLSARRDGPGGDGRRGLSFALTPSGTEIHSEMGQSAGPQGLHRDTFDDWSLADGWADVPAAFAGLESSLDASRQALLDEWKRDCAKPWSEVVPALVGEVLGLDSSEGSRTAMAHALVTWVAAAIRRCDWVETQNAVRTLRQVDPDGRLTEAPMQDALSGVNTDELAQHLDENETADHARFASLMVALGHPALDIACSVMCAASKVRVRAAATSAVCYICGENPEWLTTYLTDSRWQMVRNVVFALGQIGGDEIAPLLRLASEHYEVRVRRAVVQSLGALPLELRAPMLIKQLSTRDSQLLASALGMLTRARDPRVARAILAHIQKPDFASRSEENKRALFTALAEVAGDESVPALERLLNEGGWFARRTVERIATARTLRRIGSEKALGALEVGLRSKSEAVRSVCLEAMSRRMAP